MKNNSENNYNQAAELLKKGLSKQEVLLRFSEFQEELAPLLELTAGLLSLPKTKVPEPAMQRKYAFKASKRLWLGFIHISKFAGVSIGLMLIFSCFAATGYAAWNSNPGQVLFPLKKTAEKLELAFVPGANSKANFQVAIAQKRLNEAQSIFNDPNSNVAQKTAALNELADQTQNALAVVGTITKSHPQASANRPLLYSLKSITQEQQRLLAAIQPGSQIQTAASGALQTLSQNDKELSEIKKSVAVADSDQSLTSLNSNPNSVAVLGDVGEIFANKITVEETTFTLTPQTVIQDASGTALTIKNLSAKAKVNIIGVKNQNVLTAQEILVINQPVIPAAIANNSAANTSTPSSTAAALVKKLPEPDSQTSASTTAAVQDPNSAVGAVIFEDPRPQFVK